MACFATCLLGFSLLRTPASLLLERILNVSYEGRLIVGVLHILGCGLPVADRVREVTREGRGMV